VQHIANFANANLDESLRV